MSLQIRGIGTAVPAHSITQIAAAEAAASLCGLTDKQRRLLPILYRQSGVSKRHSVVLTNGGDGPAAEQSFYGAAEQSAQGPGTAERMRVYAASATSIAAEACRKALAAAEVQPEEITHLVTVSCSGFCAPGVDVQLIRELGLSAQTARTHVGFMGCHGALNGLRVARAFTDALPKARVLLCAVEICSLHHQYGWNPEQIVANALFADGAAAAVCTGAAFEPEQGPSLQLLSSASAVVPLTEDLMSWRIGDHGFEMGLSPRVPEVIRGTLQTWMSGWLADHGMAIDQVAEWAIHPGGPRILQACIEALALGPESVAASTAVLSEFGNMSSPTILFVLQRLMQESAAGPWVLLAFGPGLTIEAALVEPHFVQTRPAARSHEIAIKDAAPAASISASC
jgi:predicted naringenin-chalcone synthase